MQEHIIDDLLSDVLGGAHASTIDGALTGELSEDFDVSQSREWAKTKLPFIESCIARQQAIHVGLSGSELARLEEQERSQKIDMYSNRLQQDVACYVAEKGSHQSSQNAYNEDCNSHQQKRDQNAQKAIDKFLFNKTGQDEGRGRGGYVRLENIPLDKYSEQLLPRLGEYMREVLRSAVVARKNVSEADVGVWVVADFPAMGTLKDEVVRQVRTVVSNAFGGGVGGAEVVVSGFYPEAPKGCSNTKLSAKEKAVAGHEEDGDADMLVDDDAVEGLPAAATAQERRKTSQQMRAAIARDKGTLDQSLLLASPNLWYPEWFSLHYEDSHAAKQNRDGFVLLSIDAAADWVSQCKIVKGGLTNLPVNDRYVRVSREAAKKARLSKSIETVAAAKAAYAARYQKGWQSEKVVLEDFLGKVRNKKLVVVVDLFAAVGDRLIAFLKMLVERGAGVATPLAFMFAVESREFFYATAMVRLMQEATRMFNNEEIFVEGFCPLPQQPAAWSGKAPDLQSFVAGLREKLKVAAVDEAGNLLIPKAEDVPFQASSALIAELQRLHAQFPRPQAEKKADKTHEQEKPHCTTMKSLHMLKEKYTVLGRCAQPTFEIIVATDSQELPADGAFDEGRMVWLHNPAETKATSIEAGGFIMGLDSCGVVRSSDAAFDPETACSVLWSFARPGKHDKVGADSASLWTVPKGRTELQLITAASALTSAGKPDGNFWGFLKQVDAKKKAAYKPTEPLYVIPKHVEPGDVTVDNAGFFLGFRAAMEPDRTWEWVAPKLVMHSGGAKATFEPKPNGAMVRFVATKKINIPSQHCVRLY